MKYLLILLFFALSLNSHSQSDTEFYLNENWGFASNQESANVKVKKVIKSKKKFDLIRYKKFNNSWRESQTSVKVTQKQNNYFKLQHCLNGQVVRTSEQEIIDTTETGYIVKEYEDGVCVSKTEVSSVFPLVFNGISVLFDKRTPGKEKVLFYTNNLRYDIISDGITQKHLPQRAAMFPGGKQGFIRGIRKKLEIPEEQNADSLLGTFSMAFTIDTMGQIINPSVEHPLNRTICNELEKILSISSQSWMPAFNFDKKVPVSYVLPIGIKEQPKVFFITDKMPIYPGGDLQLRKDIASSVRYPVEAQVKGIHGKVYVSFIVGTNGDIRAEKIARGVNPLLDNEAIRVIKNLKRWTPGEKDGEKVCVSYTVPINFVIGKGSQVIQHRTISQRRLPSSTRTHTIYR